MVRDTKSGGEKESRKSMVSMYLRKPKHALCQSHYWLSNVHYGFISPGCKSLLSSSPELDTTVGNE